MSVSSSFNKDRSAAILRKKTELVYAAIGPSLIANMLAIMLLAAMLHKLVPHKILIGMSIAMVIVLGLRYINYWQWKKATIGDDQLQHWANRYTLTLAMNGAIWTIYAAWVAQTGDIPLIVLSSFIILGIAVGGLANATLLRVVYIFSGPPMFAFGITLLFQNIEYAITLGLATALQIAYIGSMARVISRTIDSSLSAEFEKEFLQESVARAAAQQDNAVQQLEWEIEQHLHSQQRLESLTANLQQQNFSAERFESLFANLSQTLSELTLENYSIQIEKALQAIGEDFHLNCIVFCQINPDNVQIHHQWADQTKRCSLAKHHQNMVDTLPWLSHSLQHGYSRHYQTITPLKTIAPRDYQTLMNSGVHSIMAIPLGNRTKANYGPNWGIAYATIGRQEGWTEETARRLKSLGELFLHAILSFNTRQALYQSEQLFGAIFKQSPYGMAILHTDGRLHRVNQQFRAMFGLLDKELPEATLIDMRSGLNTKSQVQLKTDLRDLVSGNKHLVTRQTECTLADASIVHISANLSRILDQNQQTEFIILLTEDIGEKLKLQKRNDSIARELEHTQRNAMMGELSASLAHELNQPLTAIANNAEFLKIWSDKLQGLKPENREQLLELSTDMVHDALRAGEVIRRIRMMTKPQPFSRERINLKLLIEQVLELINSELIIQKCRVNTTLSQTLPNILGDTIQLQQVLINLLINSMEAGEEKPDIETIIDIQTLQLTHDSVCIILLDNGPGLAEGTKDQIFDAFYTHKKTGMGMGLAIARGIVESHGGTLSAENTSTGGARFEIHLPVTEEERFTPENTPAEAAK